MKKEKYLYYGNVIAIILIIITVTITQKPLLSEIMPYSFSLLYTEILLLINLFYVIHYSKK